MGDLPRDGRCVFQNSCWTFSCVEKGTIYINPYGNRWYFCCETHLHGDAFIRRALADEDDYYKIAQALKTIKVLQSPL